MPRSLDLDRLKQFEAAPEPRRVEPPEPAAPRTPEPAPAAAPAARWPSREPVRDGQISIKAPLDVIARFRALCRDDRRTYADMLEILMNGHERR